MILMFNLNLTDIFDNVLHKRLIYIFQSTNFLSWMTQIIHFFLTDRHTKIIFFKYKNKWKKSETNISQKSSLSSILFFFFVSDLLIKFQQHNNKTLTFKFINNTNLIIWNFSAQFNCQKLKAVHEKYIMWMKHHELRFASKNIS